MISLLHLNRLTVFIVFFAVLIFGPINSFSAVDIWKNKENTNKQKLQTNDEENITIESPIISGEINKITIEIDEQQLEQDEQQLIGLFDPEENDFNLDLWTTSDGKDIKEIISRINKLKLSKFSEDLLFKVLFTNAYPPQKNLTSKEFIKMKVNWLIKNKRINDLEKFVSMNPKVGEETKAIKFLVDENLSNGDIKSACKKINILDKTVENNYLEKFKIYCLIHEERNNEAQLIYDLLIERGFKDSFFEDKINFLLGTKEKAKQKIVDNNLLNFYLSYITNENFTYEPTDKTDKYIWRYLSAANLIQTKDFEDEDIILTYEKAASENSFNEDELFKIYLRMNFNFNQLLNATEIYKNLPNYKARALIYQSVLLNDNVEKKIYLAFLLKDLFAKDKLLSVYSKELSRILGNIDSNKIPDNYVELVNKNLEKNNKITKKIKFDNEILHRSKIIRHFINNNDDNSRTEKDFKSVYKKVKKNKKYFVSIKDIVLLESLLADGIDLPKELNFTELSSGLTVPQNLQDLAEKGQVGLIMLKIIEIIGEDNIEDLDPETIYFLTKILNELNLKKIRNNILGQTLPVRV